jgi:hypothetical protein
VEPVVLEIAREKPGAVVVEPEAPTAWVLRAEMAPLILGTWPEAGAVELAGELSEPTLQMPMAAMGEITGKV